MSRLRESGPKIWEFECASDEGYSPTIHNDTDASSAKAPPQAAVIKVAALSNFDIAVESEPMVTQNVHDIAEERFLSRAPLPPVISPTSHQDLLPTASTSIAKRFLYFVAGQLPSSSEKRGDKVLNRTREMVQKFESVISSNDRKVIEDRIDIAVDTKSGLDSKSGISKYLQARDYHKSAKLAYRYAKVVIDQPEAETMP